MKSNRWITLVALAAIASSLWNIHRASDGVTVRSLTLDGTPVRVYRGDASTTRPVVVIAHGFAGSQQLMQSFALTFARNGYIAVTFDFPGHGRNLRPLTGSITEDTGATRALLAVFGRVADYGRTLSSGPLAVLGHSMASDIVVRYARAEPSVAATIAVSMFSNQVTADAPRNLLIIVGDWEPMLKREALRAVGLATAPAAPQAGTTYGAVQDGTARRAAFSAHVEHASVLFSEDSLRESLGWLDLVFGTSRPQPPVLDGRGPWILLLIAGVVLLAKPLSALLPRVAVAAAGPGLRGRALWIPMLLPALATPLLLRVVPTHFLPVLVGDYLAVHFAAYGLLTLACAGMVSGNRARWIFPAGSHRAFALSTLAVIGFGFVALVFPLDAYVTSFVPGAARIPLIAALLVGTLVYFLSDEWLTRGAGVRGAYAVSKLAFLASLAAAVALDLRHLFFLAIIVPVIALFFVIHGLFSGWAYRRTGHPFVAGIANAVAFAWAIGVTFPLLAG